MRLSTLRRPRGDLLPGVSGTARLDRRTLHLTKRLRSGDVAVISHVDLDRASADALLACGVSAVVNAAESISGRYPNLGPEVLSAAGVPLVDNVGAEVLGRLTDGEVVRVHDGVVYVGAEPVAEGEVLDTALVGQRLDRARAGLAVQLQAFTMDAAEHLRRDHELLLDGIGIPEVSTPLRGREVVVVAATHDHRADLRGLRGYLRDRRPVLVGVEGGADMLLDAGLTPHLAVGDLDELTERVLRSGAEIVVHLPHDGSIGNRERLERLGVEPVGFATSGTSQDAALLLVDAAGADIVVVAGGHPNLVEFFDQGRPAMASAFLTRLKVGPHLLDARAAARLHASRLGAWHLVLLVLTGLLAIGVSVAATPVGAGWLDAGWIDQLGASWHDVVGHLQGLFG